MIRLRTMTTSSKPWCPFLETRLCFFAKLSSPNLDKHEGVFHIYTIPFRLDFFWSIERENEGAPNEIGTSKRDRLFAFQTFGTFLFAVHLLSCPLMLFTISAVFSFCQIFLVFYCRWFIGSPVQFVVVQLKGGNITLLTNLPTVFRVVWERKDPPTNSRLEM